MLVGVSFFSCNEETSKNITEVSDYDKYLSTGNDPSYKLAIEQNQFWEARLATDSSGVGDLGPLAQSFELLFDATGNVDFLKKSEKVYKKAISIAADKDSYKRALAHNYISQHRFKEAKSIMEELYAGPTNKIAAERILFDVYMELGDYDKADSMLGKIKDNSNFDYLIRLAKWSDHQGDLDSAITFLEKAKEKADESKNKDQNIWIYSNIGDFYGHAGRFQDSYNSYLKTLEFQPDNAYVKKQIAWLNYSNEKNTDEAFRILDFLQKIRKVPDYHLLKAEMYEYLGDEGKKAEEQKTFLNMIEENSNYSGMYNTYLINVFAETDPKKALQLAQQEITNRETPETYQLLAYAQLVNGQKEEALKTIETKVEGKTSEPKALFHAALVYEANGKKVKVKELKAELLGASYELGPLITRKIEKL